jgi:5-methylcytosine-specific restriction endonuclease McrA
VGVAKPKGTDERIRRQLRDSRLKERERFDRAPLPYPIEFNQQIDLFVEAVRVAVTGDPHGARLMVEAMDHGPMVTWFDETAQHVGSVRVSMFGGQRGRRSSGGKRDLRLTRVRRIAARDGYLCGYCDIRAIEPEILRKIDTMLGGGVLHKRSTPRNNRSYHGIWLMTAVTLDHIEPLAKHHDDSDENLVTCCWSCNFGKYHYELDELGLRAPSSRRGRSTGWSGARELIGHR